MLVVSLMGVMGIKKRQQLLLKALPLPQTSVPAAGPTSQLLWHGGGLFGFLVLS